MNLPQPILVDVPNFSKDLHFVPKPHPIVKDATELSVEEGEWNMSLPSLFMKKFFYHINSESYSHLQVVEPNCQTHSNVILLEKENMKHLYALSHIPNDYDGWDFIRQVKKYLNKDDYTFKVRGQKLMDSFKSTDLDCQYGYPIEKSKLLRAYFHKKKPKPNDGWTSPTYTFEIYVESNVLRTDSYLVSAKSEAEAKSLVESGELEPDDTRYPDSELEIKYGVIKNLDTGKTLSWEK